MMYTVYSIVNKNGFISENILLETEEVEKAREMARNISAYDKLEPNPAEHSVEIRFNEDFDRGNYETIDF